MAGTWATSSGWSWPTKRSVPPWGAKTSKKYVDISTSKKIHKAARPFIEWLENAESAGLGTPCLEGFLRHKVVLVVAQQDGRDLGDELRVKIHKAARPFIEWLENAESDEESEEESE
jgi:hypothetical protein